MTDAAADTRWKPLRAGIRNIWEYDDQVFGFADGRGILRGPNGSGKSNALALLFPFLIDGTMSAAAMDPFAGGRSMRSLLLGAVRDDAARSGKFRHDQRVGYVWLEFVRLVGGNEQHVTIGCGARATAQRDATSWFFVTPRRVGIDLDLAPDGEVLSRGRLAEAIGTDAVSDSAEAHRTAVDRALFGFGAERHRKLVALIRVLRRPQLAGKLDPELLSSVLTQGLPALSGEVLDNVATSLDHLEATQREVDELKATRAVIDAFLPVYRRYLQVEAAERSGAVLDAAGSRRRAHGDLKATRREVELAATALRENEAARRAAEQAYSAALGEQRAAIEAPAYQDAASLQEAADGANEAEKRADLDEGFAADAAKRAGLAVDGAEKAASAADDALGAADRALTSLLDAADRADVSWTLSDEDVRIPDALDTGYRVVERARRADVAEVRVRLRARDDARRDHRRAEEELARALFAADQAEQAAETARSNLDEERSRLAEEVDQWLAGAPGLGGEARIELRETVDSLGEPGAVSPGERYRALVSGALEALAAAEARTTDALALVDRDEADLRAERRRVEAEVDPGPEPPTWRQADRTGRAGAPLWACCDFGDSVPESDRAGLEAALAAAGLLDAWISPDSGVAAPGDDRGDGANVSELDSWLDVTDQSDPARAARPRLSMALRPLPPPGAGLTEHRITAVLESIGLGEIGVAVDPLGKFRLGPLRGRATADSPEFIGAEARAERRRRRLAEIDAALADLASRRTGLQADLDHTVASRHAIVTAQRSAPPATPVLDAHAAWVENRVRAEAEAASARRSRENEETLAAEVERQARALADVAARHRTGDDAAALAELDRLLDELARSGSRAVEARRRAIELDERAGQTQAHAEDLVSQQRERARHAERSRAEATSRRARAEALRRERGAEVEAAVARVQGAGQLVEATRAEGRLLDEQRSTLDRAEGVATQAARDAEGAVARAEHRASEVSARVGVLRRRDVLAFLTPSGPLSSGSGPETPGEDPAPFDPPADPDAFAGWLADHLGRGRPAEDERANALSALDRAQKVLMDELHHTFAPTLAHDDGITLVEVTADSGVVPLARLVRELADQQVRLEALLTEGDREVFERFLLGQVAHDLRRLLLEAVEFVNGVNQALAAAPTASGMRVELRWQLAGDDPAIKAAIGLLRRDTGHLGTDDLATLRTFFERVIAEQRAERSDGGYRAVLEAALDYRAWHVFRPYLRSAGGGTTKLTLSTFKGLSGGEQAVALHLPLFAAASAHYNRAQPTAPRLIALDEAFAGIDEAMRGELMGLTVAFDLDVVMTGHELWGAYEQVPAVAVHDLLRRPPAEGVSVMSMRWQGGSMSPEVDDRPGPETWTGAPPDRSPDR